MWFEPCAITNLDDKNISEVVQRLKDGCEELTRIELSHRSHNTLELHELLDALIEYPNVVRYMIVPHEVDDAVGVKLARFITVSQHIEFIYTAFCSIFTEKTYIAIAKALRINSTLQSFSTFQLPPSDTRRIDFAFINALRLNPMRPINFNLAFWSYSYESREELPRLCKAVKLLGRPSLLEVLVL